MYVGLRHHFGPDAIYNDLDLEEELDESFLSQNFVFRLNLFEYIQANFPSLTNRRDPWVMDQYGVLDTHFVVRIRNGRGVRDCFDVEGNCVNQVQFQMDTIFNRAKFEQIVGEYMKSRFWLEAGFTWPCVALKYRLSIMFYSFEGMRRDHTCGRATTLFFHRPDNRVQSYIFDDFRPPIENSIALTLSGNHYKWIKYHADFSGWSPPPILHVSGSDEATADLTSARGNTSDNIAAAVTGKMVI
jgi:hypothetical protein